MKTLAHGEIGIAYTIMGVETNGDEELEQFLFSLGCYAGETVTIVSTLNKNFVITIKDARYSIDDTLAQAIYIQPQLGAEIGVEK